MVLLSQHCHSHPAWNRSAPAHQAIYSFHEAHFQSHIPMHPWHWAEGWPRAEDTRSQSFPPWALSLAKPKHRGAASMGTLVSQNSYFRHSIFPLQGWSPQRHVGKGKGHNQASARSTQASISHLPPLGRTQALRLSTTALATLSQSSPQLSL